jgi:hypothetical protein
MLLHIAGVKLALREGFIFRKKLGGCSAEKLAAFKFAGTMFELDTEVPILGLAFGVIEALFLGRIAAIFFPAR